MTKVNNNQVHDVDAMKESITQNLEQQMMYCYQSRMSLLKDAIVLSQLDNYDALLTGLMCDFEMETIGIRDTMLASIKNGAPSALQLELSMATESAFKNGKRNALQTREILEGLIESIRAGNKNG